MAPVVPNPKTIRSFSTEAHFEAWLARHHDRDTEIWIKVHKKDSGLPSVTCPQALDVALCWGWIDGLRKSFDERSFLQRYTPRRPKSPWSQINRDHVARLTAAGRMTPAGQRQIDAARADGRWEGAAPPIRLRHALTRPPELLAFLRHHDPAVRDLALALRQIVHDEMTPCHELIVSMRSKVVLIYGATAHVFDDGDDSLCHIGVFARHVLLGLPRGVELGDPTGVLKGTGKAMRHIKLTSLADVSRPEVREVLRRVRRGAGLAPRNPRARVKVTTRVKRAAR